MTSLEQAQKLYDEGKMGEALIALAALLVQQPDGSQNGEIRALMAWCHYHRKEYKDAHDVALVAGAATKAKELLATMYAAVPGYVDDTSLQWLIDELHGNVAVTNALLIRVRAKDLNLFTSHDSVLQRVLEHRGDEVRVAHVYNNAARFFQEKARDDADLITALGLWDCALLKYGSAANYHHRAALYFWKSHVLERLFGKQAAQFAAMRACELWRQQVALDPTNQSFQQKLAEAEKRRAALVSM